MRWWLPKTMSFECGEKMSEIQYLDSIVMVCQLVLVFPDAASP